jgi:hypothetical protein
MDTQSTGPGQRVFSVSASAVPLVSEHDVWQHAGGALKSCGQKCAFCHQGGTLTLSFEGLKGFAIFNALRVIDSNDKVLASANASQINELRSKVSNQARPFRPVHAGEVAFFNVDHSPVGAWASLVYGMEGCGGMQFNTASKRGQLVPDEGLIVAVRYGKSVRLMPFCQPPAGAKSSLTPVCNNEVKRTLGACTDHWEIPLGVSWTHYEPSWRLKEIESASPLAIRRFVLPATWMEFQLDNSQGLEELHVLLSLKQPAERASHWRGHDGYIIDTNNALAVRNGDAELLTEENVRQQFGIDGATSAFLVHAAPGRRKTVMFIVAHYRGGEVSRLAGEPLEFYYAGLFKNIGEVIAVADTIAPQAQARCREVDQQLCDSGINAERQLLSAHALHSYRFNTLLLQTRRSQHPIWGVMEGECNFINTLDLTVDNAFYELAMHPWTLRNTLDLFVSHYSYVDELIYPGDKQHRFPGGLSFFHDMGYGINFSDRSRGQTYPVLMTQEELQNWILCAALYWKSNDDTPWLERNREVLKHCLASMQVRDDVDSAKRDGVTSMVSCLKDKAGEITTYDYMDQSLKDPVDSLYISVKSFGCYLVMHAMFNRLGEMMLARDCQNAAALTARTIVAHWDESTGTFPARFRGNSRSKIIPAIEGLIYPYMIGLHHEVASEGPYGELICLLKRHMESILVPGVGLSSRYGGWVLSDSSSTTWQSKVYLNQFITEEILGIEDDRTQGGPDIANVSAQMLGGPAVAWTCQFRTADWTALGCRHYPRGVTSALWWLTPQPR